MTLEQRINELLEEYSSNEEVVAVLTNLKADFCVAPTCKPVFTFGDDRERFVMMYPDPAPTVDYLQAMLKYHVGIETVDPSATIRSLDCLDSLDHIELLMYLEDEFAMEIDDGDAERLFVMPLTGVAEWLKKRLSR